MSSKERILKYVEQLLEIGTVYEKSAIKHMEEANKFEFEVCDLLLKGAGASIMFYIGLLKLQNTHEVNILVLIFLFVSMGFGIYHRFAWSEVCNTRYKKEFAVSLNIMAELEKAISEDKEESGEKICNLWERVTSERKEFTREIKNAQKGGDYIFHVAPSHLSRIAIFCQIIFIVLGVFVMAGVDTPIINFINNMISGK